jgi:hypothetical protein
MSAPVPVGVYTLESPALSWPAFAQTTTPDASVALTWTAPPSPTASLPARVLLPTITETAPLLPEISTPPPVVPAVLYDRRLLRTLPSASSMLDR